MASTWLLSRGPASSAAIILFIVASASALADPVDKSELRMSPKTTQASPNVYFDPLSGTFKKRPAPGLAAPSVLDTKKKVYFGPQMRPTTPAPHLSSSEENLSAILPLVRFKKAKEQKRKKAEKGNKENVGGGDLLRIKRLRKKPSPPPVKATVKRLVKVRTRPAAATAATPSRVKLASSKKRRVLPQENDLDRGDKMQGREGEDDLADDDDYLDDYGSESRTSVRNAPGPQFGASTRKV